MKKIIAIILFLTFFLTPIYSFGASIPYEESQFKYYSGSHSLEESAYYAICDIIRPLCELSLEMYKIIEYLGLGGFFGISSNDFYYACLHGCGNIRYGENIDNKAETASREKWRPPTAEEEALEKPLIDPIDIVSIFGGGLIESLFKGTGKIATKATEKVVYYYFEDSSGAIAKNISKEGIKASNGFFHTLGYEGKVFVSDIAPSEISKLNLFSYGIKDANSFAKVIVQEGDLAVPAQAIYYGEKGAKIIKDSSGLYKVGASGAKYLSQDVIKETGSLAVYKESIGSIVNNALDAPRCLTRYWLLGGTLALDAEGYLNK